MAAGLAVPRVVSGGRGDRDVVHWVRSSDGRLRERPLQTSKFSYTLWRGFRPGRQRLLVAFVGGNARRSHPAGAAGPFSADWCVARSAIVLPVGVSWDDFSNEHPDGPALHPVDRLDAAARVGDFPLALTSSLFFLAGGGGAVGLFRRTGGRWWRPGSSARFGCGFRLLPPTDRSPALAVLQRQLWRAAWPGGGGVRRLFACHLGVFVEGKRRASAIRSQTTLAISPTQHSLGETDP